MVQSIVHRMSQPLCPGAQLLTEVVRNNPALRDTLWAALAARVPCFHLDAHPAESLTTFATPPSRPQLPAGN